MTLGTSISFSCKWRYKYQVVLRDPREGTPLPPPPTTLQRNEQGERGERENGRRQALLPSIQGLSLLDGEPPPLASWPWFPSQPRPELSQDALTVRLQSLQTFRSAAPGAVGTDRSAGELGVSAPVRVALRALLSAW